MSQSVSEPRLRIGLLAADPLRTIGLQAIFEALPASGEPPHSKVEIIPLTVAGILQDASLTLVIIDASTIDQLFDLLASFRLYRPHTRVVVLGNSDEPAYIERVIAAGARGYLLENANEADIRMAINVVRDDSVWAPRKVLARLLDVAASVRFVPPSGAPVLFTRRERQVLELLTAGRSNREIALSMEIDESTVKAHISRIMRKVGVDNRIALSLYAVERMRHMPTTKKQS